MDNRLTILASTPIRDPETVRGERLASSATGTIGHELACNLETAEVGRDRTEPRRLMSPKRLRLRANFAWTMAGNVTSAGCAWLIVVAIVKLGSMEMAGRYAFSQAIVVPIVGFSMLQLRAIFATDAGNEYQFSHYLALRTITTILALFAMVVVAFGTTSGRTVQQLTLAVGFGAAVEAMADVIYGGLQQRERMDFIALSMMCRSILALAAAVGTLWLTESIVHSLWAGAIAKALVLVALDIPLGMVVLGGISSRSSGRHWAGEVFKEARTLTRLLSLAWYSLPLGFVMLLLALQMSLPRYLIENYLDSTQLGIFSALFYAAISGTIIVSALAQSAAPRMAQHYQSRDARGYYILIAKLAAIGGAFGVCGVVLAVQFGRPLLAILYAPGYAEHNNVLVWLMAASGVNYVSTFFGWGMTAARQIRIQLPLFASVVVIMFAAGCLLVPRWGITGAAITVLVGALMQLTGTLIFVLRAIPGGGAFVRAEAQP